MITAALRDDLVQLSLALGQESRQFALLGEGNASVDCGDGTFWVKASGRSLGSLSPAELCRLRLDAVLTLMARPAPSEAELEAGLEAARAERGAGRPSVEAFLHALCLREGGARWVGHTHPVSVNSVLCSRLGAEPFRRHIFPDAVVVCGLEPAVVPYADPGLALARALRLELRRYQAAWGRPPKLLLMESHGLVALGQSAREVVAIHLMADKWAKTLLGTYALGGPAYLPEAEAQRIDARLDEAYRRRVLAGEARESERRG